MDLERAPCGSLTASRKMSRETIEMMRVNGHEHDYTGEAYSFHHEHAPSRTTALGFADPACHEAIDPEKEGGTQECDARVKADDTRREHEKCGQYEYDAGTTQRSMGAEKDDEGAITSVAILFFLKCLRGDVRAENEQVDDQKGPHQA